MNRWLAGHVWWPLTERLVGRDTMRRVRKLRQSDRALREQIRAIQQRKLQRIISLAAAHCPFYRERFRACGLEPGDENITPESLQALPFLTRDTIRENLDGMRWLGAPGRQWLYATGGSSGQPLRFYTDASRQAADWAARWRARGWWGISPGDREIWIWGSPVEARASDHLRRWRDALLNQEILSAFEMSDAAMDRYVERLQHVQPVCVYGYPSSLGLLARHALETRRLPPGSLGSRMLRAVFTTGEVLLAPDRVAIEAAFGTQVVVEYGSRDGGLIALGCPAGLLHVSEENAIIEIVDEDGRPVAPGESGQVVVTCLETFAMPIIRYRIGDLARLAPASAIGDGGRCPCGSAHLALAEVRGRLTDHIVRKDEGGLRRMHALSLIYVLRAAPGIRQFRIVQPDLQALDVELVCDGSFTPDRERMVVQQLAQRMGAGVSIHLHRRDSIPPSPSGKHTCVVSHVC